MKLAVQFFDSLPLPVQKRLFPVLRPRTYRELAAHRRWPPGQMRSLARFDELRCLFIHIPKAAGTSVAPTLFGGITGHDSLRMLWLLYSPEEFRSYFKFTFVRNPWSRLVSAYHYLLLPERSASTQKWVQQNIGHYSSFDQFVRDWIPDNALTSGILHFQTQSSLITLAGEVRVDFLGRVENLDADFATIANRLGCDVQLPHLNRGRSELDYRSLYTPVSRQIVADVYREDIQRFGYEF